METIVSVRDIDGAWTVTFISRRGYTMTVVKDSWESAMQLANLAASLAGKRVQGVPA